VIEYSSFPRISLSISIKILSLAGFGKIVTVWSKLNDFSTSTDSPKDFALQLVFLN